MSATRHREEPFALPLGSHAKEPARTATNGSAAMPEFPALCSTWYATRRCAACWQSSGAAPHRRHRP